jgi:hypothetical protein
MTQAQDSRKVSSAAPHTAARREVAAVKPRPVPASMTF